MRKQRDHAHILMLVLLCLTQFCQAQAPGIHGIGIHPNVALGDSFYVIGARPSSLHGARIPGAGVTTARTAITVTAASGSIRLVYGNWYGGSIAGGTWGEIPNSNTVFVQASLQQMGTSVTDQTPHRVPVTFGGSQTGICVPGTLLYSDPIEFSVSAGQTFFVYTCVNTNLPTGPSVAPILATAATGGTLTAGSYQVICTYVYPEYESIGSAATSVTTTGATSTITVTAPAAVSGASGYRVYIAPVNTTISSTQDALLASGTIPFGNSFTITAPPSVTALRANITPYFSGGIGTGGGTTGYGVGNGEGTSAGVDYCADGSGDVVQSAGDTNHYSPVAVQGDCYGNPVKSVALIGDSIMAGYGDGGYLPNSGGFGVRALTNQTGLTYVQGTNPSFGYTDVAQSGDTAASYANPAYNKLRLQVTQLCTNVISNYGTNDLIGAAGSAAGIVTSLLTIAADYTSQNIPFFQTTLSPKTYSTDGWQTVAHQSVASVTAEGFRRSVNNWLRDSTAASIVLSETPFGVYATGTPTTNFYAGGNGTAVGFVTAYPFTEGTEMVQVNGAVQLSGPQYTYLAPSGTMASGIRFVKAPASGATVKITYRKIAGFTASGGSLTHVFDTASAVEVTPANVPTNNSNTGGFWLQPLESTFLIGTTTAGSLDGIMDATQTWTANQYKGNSVLMTSGPAAGQSCCLSYTTTDGFMNVGFMGQGVFSLAPTANGGDGYILYDCITQGSGDGIHPSSHGYVLMSAKIDTTQFR
jgi:lysophospholipase L1-like esterase